MLRFLEARGVAPTLQCSCLVMYQSSRLASFSGSCAIVLACVSALGCTAPTDVAEQLVDVEDSAEEPSMIEMAKRVRDVPERLCAGISTHASIQATLLLALTYGRWHYAARVSNDGEVSDASRCDSTMAYQIGNDEPYPLPDRMHAAACAIVRGEVVPLRVWRTARKGCSEIECGPTLGLVWYETNGQVFSLDENGHPEGPPIMTLAMVRGEKGKFDLEQRISGMSTTTILKRTKANLVCVTPMPPTREPQDAWNIQR